MSGHPGSFEHSRFVKLRDVEQAEHQQNEQRNHAIGRGCPIADLVEGQLVDVRGEDLRRVTRTTLSHDVDKLEIVERDRKSTRLNSSHVSISYAVFCLKNK